MRGLPPKGIPELLARQPAIYFGERRSTGPTSSPAPSRRRSTTRPRSKSVTTSYAGKGGIRLSNMLRRLAFAVRFGDTDLVALELHHAGLAADHAPQHQGARAHRRAVPAVRQRPVPRRRGRQVLLGRSTRTRRPTGSRTPSASTPRPDRRREPPGVDELHAQLGEGRHGRIRRDDELLPRRRDRRARVDVPGGVPDARSRRSSEMPPELKKHMRYPEDLFKVQALQYRAYHITDAEAAVQARGRVGRSRTTRARRSRRRRRWTRTTS